MIELLTKNVIIGTLVIIINAIPLITKRYNFVPFTALISLVLILIGNYFG